MATRFERTGSVAYRMRGFALDDRFVAEDGPEYEVGAGGVAGLPGSGAGTSGDCVIGAEVGAHDDDDPSATSARDASAEDVRLECALAVAARPASVNTPDAAATDASRVVAERIAEGVALRLATELIQGTRQGAADRAANVARLRRATGRAAGQPREPDTPGGVASRLKSLARAGDRLLAEQLKLLVRFDDEALYRADGCRTMAMWMGVHMSLAPCTATERLRIGRALPMLPVCESLFALGKLGFSQLRDIVRHATPATDAEFAAACAGLSIAATKAYCERFRHDEDADEDAANAAAHGAERAAELAAMRAWQRRFLRTRRVDAHSTRIEIELPNDVAADFMRALEHAEDWIREGGEDDVGAMSGVVPGTVSGAVSVATSGAPSEGTSGGMPGATSDAAPAPGATTAEPPSAAQLRADAAVLLGRRSLAHAGSAVATADRYRVHVNVQAAELADEAARAPGNGSVDRPDGLSADASVDAPADPSCPDRPPLRPATPREVPHIQGLGPIPRAVARRLAESAGFTLYALDDEGQPVGSMKKAPLFTKRQLRAMRARDRCCQVPGCGSTRHLDGHHVVHRSDGGRSGIEDGVMVCGGCHRLLHEGGFRLERTSAAEVEAELGAASLGAPTGTSPGELLSPAARTRVARKLVTVRRYRLVGPDDHERIEGRRSANDPVASRAHRMQAGPIAGSLRA